MKTSALFLLAVLLIACTDSQNGETDEVLAGIGNDCGPADAREVWLRVAADSNATRCPASTLDGIRIRVQEGFPLDSLRTGTYTDLPARDCRDTVIHCPSRTATVRIHQITDTEVRGTYELFDSSGTVSSRSFKAERCIITPLCG